MSNGSPRSRVCQCEHLVGIETHVKQPIMSSIDVVKELGQMGFQMYVTFC